MATFEITTPDGRVFEVVGKDAQGAAAAVKKMLSSQPQQGGQQQTQPQQDDRSFPRAIADVGASFAGAVPKAAGAMVSIGSQVPVLNKVADPIAQSLMNAGEFVDDALLSDYQKNMNADMANAVAKSALQLGPDATISDHIENMKSQGGAAAKFIMENPSQALMLTSQALPYLVGGGIIGRGVSKLAPSTAGATAGAIGEGSIAAGAVTGDIIAQLEAEGIEGYTPDRLAALPAGVLTAVIGRMGAKVNQKLGGADVDTAIAGGGTGAAKRGLSPKGAAIGGTTELGEEFLQSAQEQAFTNIGTGDPISDEVGSSAVQGAAAGFGMGSVIGSNVFNRDGSLRNPTDLQIAQRAAAGDVARALRKTAEDNEYNLGDIDPTSGYGAKQALEDYRRTQVTGIVNLVKSLKSQLDPKQAQTLEELLQDYVPAEAGITAAKRKVSAKVTTDQFDAVKRLVAGTQEGDTLLQELQKSNIVTDLFKDGMKGGVSKFTDLFNPLMTGGQSYDPTRVGNVVVGGLPLLSTGGQSLIPQAAIVLGGQAIDKVLGGKGGTRRKLVKRFVKLNEGNDGLGRPTGPSLIAQAQQAERDEEQEAESSAALKEAVRRFRSERGGPEPDSAPLGMLYMGTGLDRSGLEQLLPHLEQHYGDRPEVTELINQTRRNLAGENNQITGLTDWISILNSVLSSDATIDGLRIAEPDGNDARNQRRLAGFGPSVSQSTAGTAQQQQQTQGRSPAEQSGIDSNRALLERLRQGLAANTSLTPAERGRLETAFDQLGDNLGTEAALAAMDVVSRLKSDGISESLINRHIMPYVERVLRQQGITGTDLAFDEDFETPRSPSMAQVMHEEMYQSSPKMRAKLARELGLDITQKQIRKLLKKRDKRRGQDFIPDYVDPLIEARDTRKSRTPTEIEKLQARQAEIEASRKAMQQKFADERNAERKRYEREKAARKATRDNLLAAARQARKLGRKVRSSSGRDGKISSYYVSALTGPDLRISDHAIPANPRREFMARENGRSDYNGYYGPELIVDDTTTDAEVLAFLNGTDLAFDEDFDASKPALAAETNPFNLSQNDLDATNVRIAATEAEAAEMRADTFKPKKKRTLVEAAQYLQDRWERATGRTEPFENTPENIDRLAAMMATEAYMALQKPNNAIGWYDRKIKAAKAIMSLIDPRITATAQNEHAFDFALAVTSNGVAVEMNFKYAHEVFDHYMNTGEMPASTFNKGGERNQAMVDAFEFFNAYQNSGRNYPLETFLSDEFTVRDLNEFVAEFNTQYGTSISVPSSEAIDAVVYGSFIFGPKIGQGFYQNIRGNYDPLTMDIWWMRMWNRFVGRPFETTKDEGLMTERRKEIHTMMVEASKAKGNTLEKRIIAKSLKDLGETKRGLRGDKVRFDRVIERMHRNYQSYFAAHKKKHGVNHKKPKNYIFTKAKTYYENTVPQLQAIPASGERPYMRQVTKAAIAKLQEKGIDISTADMQALMWYPEKLLFRKLGVQKGQGSDNDYQDAAEILAKSKGITDAEIQRVLQAPRSDANRRDAFDSEPDTQGAYGRGNRQADRYGNSQQGQESFDQDLAQQGNTGVLATPPAQQPQQQSPFNMKSLVNKMLGSQPPTPEQVKAQLPVVRPVFEIGKAGTKYADGIQDIDSAIEFAKAINVTLKLFDSQQEMFDNLGVDVKDRVRGVYRKRVRTAYGLLEGAQVSDELGEVTSLDSLTTAIHELSHGLAFDSGFESLFDQFGGISTAKRRQIDNEIDNIQKYADLYIEKNPSQRRKVRRVMEALEARQNFDDADTQARTGRYLDYVKSPEERAVDPILLYLLNPKVAKNIAPATSALVKEMMNKSTDKFQLYTYPFATMVAVVLAMMLNGRAEEEEEEQMRQQMPAGALSPQAGALSQQQQFAA